MIDFFAERRLVFRVYYQDSGTNAPVGHVPAAVLDEHPVDLALLCVGGDFHRMKGHPEGILANLKPRYVVLSHWERAQVPYGQPPWLPCPTLSTFEFALP